jgi:hypothetical protein
VAQDRYRWRALVNAVMKFRVQSQSQSQSQFATDGRSVSISWCRAPSGAHDQMFVNSLKVTVLSY